MEITAYVGDVGSGKTLSVLYHLNVGAKKGKKIYCNIPITLAYTPLVNLNWQDVEQNSIIFYDELGLGGAKSTNRIRELEENLAQSRKTLGEDGEFYYTTQLDTFMSTNLKALTDYFIFPFLTRDKKTRVPINVKWIVYGRMPIVNRFVYLDTIKNIPVKDLLKLYNTHHKVQRVTTGKYMELYEKYKEYNLANAEIKDQKRQIKKVSILLQAEEGCNISESKRYAEAIVYGLFEK